MGIATYGCKDTGNACAAAMNMSAQNGAKDRMDGNFIVVAGAGAKSVGANMTTTTIAMTDRAIIAHRGRQKREIADPASLTGDLPVGSHKAPYYALCASPPWRRML